MSAITGIDASVIREMKRIPFNTIKKLDKEIILLAKRLLLCLVYTGVCFVVLAAFWICPLLGYMTYNVLKKIAIIALSTLALVIPSIFILKRKINQKKLEKQENTYLLTAFNNLPKKGLERTKKYIDEHCSSKNTDYYKSLVNTMWYRINPP